MGQQGTDVPQLVVIAPGSYRGRRIELAREYMTVGREPTCDVRLDDPHVSRTHAALQRRGDAVYVQDLGYNAHVQRVIQQRDSFLRDIAATKTKARWLVWIGLLLFLAGFALFAAADLNFIRQIINDLQSRSTAPPSNPFGHNIGGVPAVLLGAGLAAIGMMLLVIGILLHIVATSRRRRVERELPLPPPPWRQYGPPGRAG
jgi:uncharacterized membrane protein